MNALVSKDIGNIEDYKDAIIDGLRAIKAKLGDNFSEYNLYICRSWKSKISGSSEKFSKYTITGPGILSYRIPSARKFRYLDFKIDEYHPNVIEAYIDTLKPEDDEFSTLLIECKMSGFSDVLKQRCNLCSIDMECMTISILET